MTAAAAVGAALLGATSPSTADVQPHPGMLRYPDVSKTHVVFVYANDLWVVGRDGGLATPLASPPGGEVFPRGHDGIEVTLRDENIPEPFQGGVQVGHQLRMLAQKILVRVESSH